MGYTVTGAAAVVEMDDGNPDLGTGRRVYLEQNTAVPADAKKAHVDHLLAVGLIEKSAATSKPSRSQSDENDAPAGNASLDEWRAFALKQDGVTEESIDGLGRDDLRDKFGPKQ